MIAVQNRWQQSARIIWAIFSKDLLEAIKNKTTISVLISALFVVLMYRALPLLETLDGPSNLLVYDAGNSTLVRQLENSQVLSLYTYPSPERLMALLREGVAPEIGLILPADFDHRIASGESLQLQALVMHWVSPKDKIRLESALREEIARLTGVEVQLQIEPVHLTAEAGGIGVMAGLGIIFTTVMIGLMLIPHLMLEEKKSRTLEALQVSPATAFELTAAKALVGLFYCLLAAAIGLGVYHRVVVHGVLAVLTMVCISMVIIPFGLWLGIRLEDRSQLTVFSWVFIVPLFFPMIIILMAELFPAVVVKIAGWVPTSAALSLMRFSFARSLDLGQVSLLVLYLLAWAGAGLLLVVWQVRRLDRQDESRLTAGLLNLTSKVHPQPTGARSAGTPNNARRLARIRSQSASQTKLKAAAVSTRNTWFSRVLAITAKDFREALKNRVLLSIVFGTVLLVLPNAFLPALLRSEDNPSAVVYDPGRSEIVYALSRTPGIRMQIVDSEALFRRGATEAMNEPLALSIPANFDQLAQEGKEIEVSATVVHWADQGLVARWAEIYAGRLSQASETPVQVILSETVLYPSASAGGFPQLVGIILSLSILTLGLATLPLLIVEEKEAHTFEALLVSPASLGQILAGKALAGMLFTVLVFGVASLIYAHMLTNWIVVALTALISTFFITSIGLLIGILSANPSTTNLWSGLVILLILALFGLEAISAPTWPSWLQAILGWTPGPLMTRMLTSAMAGEIQIIPLLQTTAGLAISGLVFYALDAWLIFKRQLV